ncbi:hypothetical protein MPLSOD_330067 [Mesorhizobium sp. SOD10]|nr:hypothetical protein MPLSOD_330067 [Mesorhizobium sp. SOD10]
MPNGLDEKAIELARTGIEAAAFPDDLTDIDGIPALIRTIEQRIGSIDGRAFPLRGASRAAVAACEASVGADWGTPAGTAWHESRPSWVAAIAFGSTGALKRCARFRHYTMGKPARSHPASSV